MASTNQYCPERPQIKDSEGNEKPQQHCWHIFSPTQQTAEATLMAQNVCCWCAPTWLHFPIIKIAREDQLSNEELEAINMQHGHLISMHRAQQKPNLSVVRR